MLLLAEGDAHWAELRPLLASSRVTGSRVHDGKIAALCLAHGVRELWTADRDFGRFPALRSVNPLTESQGASSSTRRTPSFAQVDLSLPCYLGSAEPRLFHLRVRLAQPVARASLQVAAELVGPVHRDQCGHRDEAAVPLGEAGALPDVAVEQALGQLDDAGE